MSEHVVEYRLCGDLIIKDGHTMFLQDVVKDLNRKSYLESKLAESNKRVEELRLAAKDYIEDCVECSVTSGHSREVLERLIATATKPDLLAGAKDTKEFFNPSDYGYDGDG